MTEIVIIVAAEATEGVILPVVFDQNDLIRRMVDLIIKGIANRDLNHLPIFEERVWPNSDSPKLLWLHMPLFLLQVRINGPQRLLFFHVIKLLLSSRSTIHEIELLHLRQVSALDTKLFDINCASLSVLLLFLLLSFHQQLRDLEFVFGHLLVVEDILLKESLVLSSILFAICFRLFLLGLVSAV